MTETTQNIASLRTVMKLENIAAYIVPGTDPHASEYIADYWKEREWISGFDGSAGTVAFSLNKAGLWTDSRYFLQGQQQLEETGIDLMKVGMPETPDILDWICSELKPGEKVGVNASMFSVNAYAAMKSKFAENGLQLVSIDLILPIWKNRPALPVSPFYVFDVQYAGQSASEKIASLRSEMSAKNAQYFVLSALDDIAWLFNIRGNDVDYNPVVIAYALVSLNKTTLYIDSLKLTSETKQYLKHEGVETASYEQVFTDLESVQAQDSIIIDGAKLNQSLYESITLNCRKVNMMSPVFQLKSIKNEVEVAGIRRAMIKDGIALTQFFNWLETNVNSGKISEISLAEKLFEFRSKQENLKGESFGTIAGYNGHGAIVHYRATPESNAVLSNSGILLLDSGGQYLDGTTDITRTIAIGTPTDEQKTDFTLVLKGHIALAMAVFPVGTRGSQLDILARKALWDRGMNYGHGTGHGVGHFLNVHEGPQNIRMDENPATLKPGMIISNEPGLYRADKYGIRIENLVHVVPSAQTEFGNFMAFETLTLFPIDTNLINRDLLSANETDWLNTYHARVYDLLSPGLSAEEKVWLQAKCSRL